MKSSIIKTGTMLAGFLLAACLSTHAEVKLPAIFSDGMVMQQQTNANLWGTATPHKKVTVTTSWNGKQYAATADKNGAWKLTVATPEAGGPYTVTFDDGTKKTLNNILIGELWLCSGQSNMEMPMKGFKNQPVENANMDILHSKNPQIRLFTVKRTSTFTPQNDVIGSWKEANPVSVRDFSATAYYFGRLVNEILDVPVGLVVAAWGGSACEAWMTADWLKAFPEAKIPQTETDIKSKNRTPTVLYNGMLHPLIGMTMKGVIWYQGEADANSSKITMPAYTKAMESMVSDYRTVFNDDSLPFMYVQLAAFDNPGGEYAAMREAQFNYMIGKNTTNGKPENVGMAVITDNTDNIKDIHPRNKSEVGRRLSLWARKLVYNEENLEYTGPIFKAVEQVTTEDGTKALKITFEDYSVMNGLKLKDNTLVGMTLAGDDKEFKTVSGYELADDNKSIIVWSDDISEPKYVNYGYYKLPTDATLFNNDDLPASAFRNYED